ncbi:hypothetical protein DFP72DRAFT_47978 [Ephemerocybe angulata]|uniref:Uncharacterized protein n=1 Tax=Ephemerocybe angulata TaxID=980116 RepID=A0A8H6LYU8_9AGAR|nr:hypothetical protein DFP72DRAFT_47978 [Tulosesus angulatus]
MSASHFSNAKNFSIENANMTTSNNYRMPNMFFANQYQSGAVHYQATVAAPGGSITFPPPSPQPQPLPPAPQRGPDLEAQQQQEEAQRQQQETHYRQQQEEAQRQQQETHYRQQQQEEAQRQQQETHYRQQQQAEALDRDAWPQDSQQPPPSDGSREEYWRQKEQYYDDRQKYYEQKERYYQQRHQQQHPEEYAAQQSPSAPAPHVSDFDQIYGQTPEAHPYPGDYEAAGNSSHHNVEESPYPVRTEGQLETPSYFSGAPIPASSQMQEAPNHAAAASLSIGGQTPPHREGSNQGLDTPREEAHASSATPAATGSSLELNPEVAASSNDNGGATLETHGESQLRMSFDARLHSLPQILQ